MGPGQLAIKNGTSLAGTDNATRQARESIRSALVPTFGPAGNDQSCEQPRFSPER